MVTEFWQTEKDFKEFLKVIDEAEACLYSYRGEKYNGEPAFENIWGTDYCVSYIILKNTEIPIKYGEPNREGKIYHWVDTDKIGCITFTIPSLDGNQRMLNGGMVLSKRWDPITLAAIPHDEAYKALFKKLSRYIKKNYKLSKDKFAYAGPDFLKEWIEGRLLACNGAHGCFGPGSYKAEFEINQ